MFQKHISLALDVLAVVIQQKNYNIPLSILSDISGFCSMLGDEGLIVRFVDKTSKYWDSVYDELQTMETHVPPWKSNLKLLIDVLPISSFYPEHLNTIETIFTKPNGIPRAQEKELLTIFGNLITTSVIFIHNMRGPVNTAAGGRYKKSYSQHINVKYHSEKWKLKLQYN